MHICILYFNCPLCEEAHNSRAPIANQVCMHVVNTYNCAVCGEAHNNRAPIVDRACLHVVHIYNCAVCEKANNKWPLITLSQPNCTVYSTSRQQCVGQSGLSFRFTAFPLAAGSQKIGANLNDLICDSSRCGSGHQMIILNFTFNLILVIFGKLFNMKYFFFF